MNLKRALFGMIAAAALAVPAMAQQRYYGGGYNDRDLREDYRDLRRDYAQIDRLRADIASDQWRLDRDMRYGNWRAVEADRRDLARDQWALDELLRDVRHDRRDIERDNRYGYGYRR